MAITSSPEPSSVSGPSPRIPRVKMVGNMIEWNSPTEIRAHIARGPFVATASSTTAQAATLAKARTLSAGIRRMAKLPTKRPTIIPPHRRKR